MKHELESLSHRIGYSPPRNGICQIWQILAGAATSGLSLGFSSLVANRQRSQALKDRDDERWYQYSHELERRKYEQKLYERNMAGQKELMDYENAYNDPSAVRDRFLQAGYSPMAALGQGSFDTAAGSPPGSPQVSEMPYGQLPQVFNPAGNMQAFSTTFSQFLNSFIAQKKSVAEINKLESEADKNAAETATIEALRKGQIDLQGVEIKLKGSQAVWTEDDRKRIAAVVEKTKIDIQVAMEYMRYMGVHIDYVAFQKWLQQQDYDLRSKEIASKIALNAALQSESGARRAGYNVSNRFANLTFQDRMYQVQSQRWRTARENEVLHYYHSQKYGQRAADYADRLGEYQVKNIPSDLSIAVRQGMATVSSILQPVGQIMSAYSQFAVGNFYTTKRSQMLNSTFQSGNLFSDPVDGGVFWNSTSTPFNH